MAQRHIELLIGRLVTDEAFRASFLSDPAAELERLAASGYELTPVEIDALRNVRSELWSSIADQLDPRLQKASLRPR